MPPLEGINWIAALVGAVGYFIVGALWYGPLFGKQWAAGMGIDMEEGAMEPALMGVSFIVQLALAVAVAALVATVGSTGEAVLAAFWLWLGLVATSHAINAVWDPRPWTVYGINVGYHLVGMIVVALVVAAWPA